MLSIDQALHSTCSVAACISQTLPFVYKSEKELFLVIKQCFVRSPHNLLCCGFYPQKDHKVNN